MDGTLIAALRREERALLTELHDSLNYRRLEEIRRLLVLYETQPPVGTTLDALLDAPRAATPQVIALGQGPRAKEAAA